MNNKYSKAYTEVLEILKYLPQNEYSKIPKEKIAFYNKNMDSEYLFSFDPTKDLNKQNISREANAIILTLYRDYFANEVQKGKLTDLLLANEINLQNELQNSQIDFKPNEIFKNMKSSEHAINTSINTPCIAKKHEENFFKQVVRKIKSLFTKKQ